MKKIIITALLALLIAPLRLTGELSKTENKKISGDFSVVENSFYASTKVNKILITDTPVT